MQFRTEDELCAMDDAALHEELRRAADERKRLTDPKDEGVTKISTFNSPAVDKLDRYTDLVETLLHESAAN